MYNNVFISSIPKSIIMYYFLSLLLFYRVLVFSPSPMVQVIVSINEGNPFSATPTGDGLYTVPWNPAHYLLGLHTISVYVQVCVFIGHVTVT